METLKRPRGAIPGKSASAGRSFAQSRPPPRRRTGLGRPRRRSNQLREVELPRARPVLLPKRKRLRAKSRRYRVDKGQHLSEPLPEPEAAVEAWIRRYHLI